MYPKFTSAAWHIHACDTGNGGHDSYTTARLHSASATVEIQAVVARCDGNFRVPLPDIFEHESEANSKHLITELAQLVFRHRQHHKAKYQQLRNAKGYHGPHQNITGCHRPYAGATGSIRSLEMFRSLMKLWRTQEITQAQSAGAGAKGMSAASGWDCRSCCHITCAKKWLRERTCMDTSVAKHAQKSQLTHKPAPSQSAIYDRQAEVAHLCHLEQPGRSCSWIWYLCTNCIWHVLHMLEIQDNPGRTE